MFFYHFLLVLSNLIKNQWYKSNILAVMYKRVLIGLTIMMNTYCSEGIKLVEEMLDMESLLLIGMGRTRFELTREKEITPLILSTGNLSQGPKML